MYIINKNILQFIKVSTCVVLLGIVYSFGVALNLNAKTNQAFDTFIERSTFSHEEIRQTPSGEEIRRYYTVSRETYELNDKRNVFTNASKNTLGQSGDIFVTIQSPYPYLPLVDAFVSTFFGGHAAILDDQNTLFEATGIGGEGLSMFNVILHPGNEPHDFDVTIANSNNYWLSPTRRNKDNPSYPYYGRYNRSEFAMLRVKGVNSEQIAGAVTYAKTQYENERLYNYTFLLDSEYKYYCSDLISRAYQSVMVPEYRRRNYATVLNDRLTTSVIDLIVSEDTYIAALVKIEGNIVNIYYLEDI
jgi:hypothetical protein